MREKGLSKEETVKALTAARKKDLKYAKDKILSSMCTSPHPVSKSVYELFVETNLGDAGLFSGTRRLESEAIAMLASLLWGRDARGFIVSGGTEANIMALWVARNMERKKAPEVVIPESAHFSFDKAADILGLRLRKAAIGREHTVNIEDVENKINKNTVALVGIAGSTEYGTTDDIEALSEIAVDRKLYLHVDAAFGGFVIPFLEELGYPAKKFDFSLEGVSSITIDPHKMGLAPIPSGGILFRDERFLKFIETSSPYLTERRQNTITGTRSGASAASVYAILKLLGRDGYRENVEKCMKITLRLFEELAALGLKVIKPVMNIIVFSHEKQDELAKKLNQKGWIISRTRRGEIRLVIMPHVGEDNITEFIADTKKILSEL